MNGDWQENLCQVLDGQDLGESERRTLVQALADERNSRQARQWLAFETTLRRMLDRRLRGNAAASREQLLAKAVLRSARRKTPALLGARGRRVWALCAAAAVIATVGWAVYYYAWRYPQPRAEGRFRVVRGGEPVETHSPERGDWIIAEAGGAQLDLGGYCRLALEADTAILLHGEAGKEEVELVRGKALSQIRPEKGRFRISTPIGELDVVGTEFTTEVAYPPKPLEQGERKMNRWQKTTVVTVAVLTGVVAFHFGDVTGQLPAGTSRVFAAETSGLPDGIKGFRGMFRGSLVSKAEKTFVVKVDKIVKVWKQNKATEPECIMGKEVTCVITGKNRLDAQHVETLSQLKEGDLIQVEAFHVEGDQLTVMEFLKKVE